MLAVDLLDGTGSLLKCLRTALPIGKETKISISASKKSFPGDFLGCKKNVPLPITLLPSPSKPKAAVPNFVCDRSRPQPFQVTFTLPSGLDFGDTAEFVTDGKLGLCRLYDELSRK